MDVVLCFTTAPQPDSARAIADALVREGLAACVNLLPGWESVYRWQGKVEQARETLLLIKTGRDRLPALEERLKSLHPYELPELLAVEATGGSAPYLAWVLSSLAASPKLSDPSQ